MPLYEYACLDCGKEFNAVLSLQQHDRKTPPCPHCKGKRVEQLVTACGVITSKKS